MKNILFPIAAVALIAGCSDKGADADGDGKITNEEVAEEMNEVELQAGEWESTFEIVDVKLEGLPEGAPANITDQMKGQVQTTKSCMTEEMAKKPGAGFFNAQKELNCEVKEFDMSGGAIKSTMSCNNMANAPGNMEMAMNGQYGPSSYDMDMTMTGEAGPIKMEFTAKNSGKRIGDCPAG